jgi:hypothetical protein
MLLLRRLFVMAEYLPQQQLMYLALEMSFSL